MRSGARLYAAFLIAPVMPFLCVLFVVPLLFDKSHYFQTVIFILFSLFWGIHYFVWMFKLRRLGWTQSASVRDLFSNMKALAKLLVFFIVFFILVYCLGWLGAKVCDAGYFSMEICCTAKEIELVEVLLTFSKWMMISCLCFGGLYVFLVVMFVMMFSWIAELPFFRDGRVFLSGISSVAARRAATALVFVPLFAPLLMGALVRETETESWVYFLNALPFSYVLTGMFLACCVWLMRCAEKSVQLRLIGYWLAIVVHVGLIGLVWWSDAVLLGAAPGDIEYLFWWMNLYDKMEIAVLAFSALMLCTM